MLLLKIISHHVYKTRGKKKSGVYSKILFVHSDNTGIEAIRFDVAHLSIARHKPMTRESD